MKPFSLKSIILGLERQIGHINSGVFVIFSAELTAPILVQWVPCFSLFNHYFYKKLSLHIRIPNEYLAWDLNFCFSICWRCYKIVCVIKVWALGLFVNNTFYKACFYSYIQFVKIRLYFGNPFHQFSSQNKELHGPSQCGGDWRIKMQVQ